MTLRTRWKNYELKSRRRKLEKECKRTYKEAKQKKNEEIIDEWYGINGWEFEAIDAEIKHNDSRDLLDHAERLYLPTPGPNEKDKWVDKTDLGYGDWSVLTPEAMTELRSAIRKDQRERRETVEFWAKIVGAAIAILTGLVGSFIGLVAVWKK